MYIQLEYLHVQGYRLVIVGHSLGAGVASVLTILLRKQFPDVICYAFSPPGCTLRYVYRDVQVYCSEK